MIEGTSDLSLHISTNETGARKDGDGNGEDGKRSSRWVNGIHNAKRVGAQMRKDHVMLPADGRSCAAAVGLHSAPASLCDFHTVPADGLRVPFIISRHTYDRLASEDKPRREHRRRNLAPSLTYFTCSLDGRISQLLLFLRMFRPLRLIAYLFRWPFRPHCRSTLAGICRHSPGTD